jgi:hypothetical protein
LQQPKIGLQSQLVSAKSKTLSPKYPEQKLISKKNGVRGFKRTMGE